MEIGSTNILGVNVSAINMDLALQTIDSWHTNQQSNYVCVTPVHSVMMCLDDQKLKQIYNDAGMVTPDGMPIVWLSRWFGSKQVSRVYGPDLLLAMCKHSIDKGYRHYFYGGAEGVADKLIENLKTQFPELEVAGAYCPPFRSLSPQEDKEIVEIILEAKPDIIWVGLGAPKQEYWMQSHLNALSPAILIGVGAAFDFHAGLVKQAPKWMQRSGLEWLFRFLLEPRRLWYRYLVNNPRFVFNMLLQVTNLKEYPALKSQNL